MDFPGADADHESAYVQLVQGLVADTLLKHHLGLHGSGAGEHHIAGANVEGGGRTLQAGEVTFQVANAPALRGFLQLSLSHELHHVRLLAAVVLFTADGKHNRYFFHDACASQARAIS